MNIRELLELKAVPGDVGIEIEMEGDNFFPVGPTNWRAETDGSLRGHAMEYVMVHPVKVENVQAYLDKLLEAVTKANVSIKHSERAGVHVHVNVQELTTAQMVTMASIYYCLEEILVDFCGPNRVGNHFCLRLKDAEFPIFGLEEARITGNIYSLEQDTRYASMNFLALFKYGTLEFRAMETTPDLSKISDWAKMLCAIRDYALKTDIEEIPAQISGHSPIAWVKMVLGEDLATLLIDDTTETKVMEGLRRIQTVIYGV